MNSFEHELDALGEDARALAVLAELDRASGAKCASCAVVLCGHDAMVSLVCGYKAAPRCLACVAADMGLTAAELRERTWRYVHGRDCFLQGWREASRREGFSPDARPHCLWGEQRAGAGAGPEAPANDSRSTDARQPRRGSADNEASLSANARSGTDDAAAPRADAEWHGGTQDAAWPDANARAVAHDTAAARADAEWHAGTMACGELVLELRARLGRMPSGATLLLTALDPAAPEDIPAWCRLTGHGLAGAEHPRYWIRVR